MTNDEHDPIRPPQRVTRYVYHVHGHAKLHNTMGESGPVVPFEVVIRWPCPITGDNLMGPFREEVRGHIQTEMSVQGSPYVVGDVMVRGVSHLHTILVNEDDPEGPEARVLS